MIKRIEIDYNLKHAPGALAMVCSADGYIIFDPNKKRPCRAGNTARPKANKNVHPDYKGRSEKSQ